MIEKLQKQKEEMSYDDAVRELKAAGVKLFFYTPMHRVTVFTNITRKWTTSRAPLTLFQDPILTADGLLLVVEPPPPGSTIFDQNTVNQLKGSAKLFVQNKAIILLINPYVIRTECLCLSYLANAT